MLGAHSHIPMSVGSSPSPSPDPSPSASSPTFTTSTKPSSSIPGKISLLPQQKQLSLLEIVWQMQPSSLSTTRCTLKLLSHLRSKATISCWRNPWLPLLMTVYASNGPLKVQVLFLESVMVSPLPEFASSCCSTSIITVLRYSEYTKALSDIVHKNALGDLVNIVLVEPVGYYHFAHSFVRGNWGVQRESSFVLMTKSCQSVSISVTSNMTC